MKEFPQISEAEFEVMKIIWEYAPISTTEVIEKLSKKSNWNPKTIQTLLLRLVKKGALTTQKNSRVFVYSPTIDKNEYLKHESSSFYHKFYNGTINSMILNFIDNDLLSEEDIDELRDLLNKRNEKGGK